MILICNINGIFARGSAAASLVRGDCDFYDCIVMNWCRSDESRPTIGSPATGHSFHSRAADADARLLDYFLRFDRAAAALPLFIDHVARVSEPGFPTSAKLDLKMFAQICPSSRNEAGSLSAAPQSLVKILRAAKSVKRRTSSFGPANEPPTKVEGNV